MLRLAALAIALLAAAGATADARANGNDLIGQTGFHVAEKPDMLVDLARRHDVGYVEIVAANPGIDPWLPEPGRTVVLPTAHLLPPGPRKGIVLNLAELRLYFYPEDGAPQTYPIGIGQDGWQTPTGRTVVVGKRVRPTWTPPASIRAERPDLPPAIGPGASNPLGNYALDLGWAAYAIHGTNKPYGVGRRVSHGCIRLYPEDIERLFPQVPVGTPVTVIDEPVKLGWSGGQLYLEIHPTQQQADELEQRGRFTPEPIPDLDERIREVAQSETARLNWTRIRAAVAERHGIPVAITD